MGMEVNKFLRFSCFGNDSAMTCELKTSVNDHEIIYCEEAPPFPKVVRIELCNK